MRDGRKDRRVTIERRQVSEGAAHLDDYGQENGEWISLATCWASIEPLNGRELFASQQTQSETTHRIVILYQQLLADLSEKDRVRLGDRLFDIRSVIDARDSHEELQLMCVTRSV